MNNHISYFLKMMVILFFIRIISFIVAMPNNFDSLWHPSAFNYFPQFITVILAIATGYTLFELQKKISKTNDKTKTHFFIYICISYLFLSFFNTNLGNSPFSYLYVLQYTPISADAIVPQLLMDLFFEPPYIFWALAIMGIIYFVCKKLQHIEYTTLFWIIPFLGILCPLNDILITMHLCGCIIALLGFRFSKGRSPLFIYSLQALLYVTICIYVKQGYLSNHSFLCVALETVLLFFIPGFILLFKSIKDNNQSAIEATWILPFLTGFFLVLPLTRLPSSYNLVNLIAIINSMLVTGNIALSLIIILLIAIIADRLIPKIGKPCFNMLFIFIALFYALDSILFSVSHLHIDYSTITWTLAMHDIVNTTLATCSKYISPSNIIVIIFVITLTITGIRSNKQNNKNSAFTFSILLLIITAQFSIMLMQLSSPLPQITRDQFFEMFKSFPKPSFNKKSLSQSQIKQGFEECAIPLQEFKAQPPAKGNQNNVILITLESLHWRYLNMFGNATQTFPLMSKLKNRMEIYPFMFSCYPESTCGDFALINSLVPYNHLYLNNKSIIKNETLVNELKKAGYATSYFSSESVHNGNLINILKTLPFDYFFHFNSADESANKDMTWSWGYKEEFTSSKIIEYLEQQPKNKPYFVWYRTVYPHSPFPVFDKKEDLVFKNTDNDQSFVPNSLINYKNSLFYLDRVLSDFVTKIDELDKKNNQNTIIFMVADHGDALGEADNDHIYSHGILITPQLTAITAILINPHNKKFKVNTNVCSQIDVSPTILDHLDLQPSTQHFCQGISVKDAIDKTRPVYLSSSEAYALVENGYYFEFKNKENNIPRIYKLSLGEDFKPSFLPVSEWNKEDINTKYEKIKKFFNIQQQFLDDL